MKKLLYLFLIIGLFIIGTSHQAQSAITITAGQYRFIVSEAYTQLVDPGASAVAGEAFQGNQWGIARINEIQKLNIVTGLYDTIWLQGQIVPEPPAGTTDTFLFGVFGGLTLQPDPFGKDPDCVAPWTGRACAPNTGLTYNTRRHAVSPATVPAPPTGTGLSHPSDYVTNAQGLETFPYNLYFIDDTVHGTGPSYIKLYSNSTNIFNNDVAAGIGAGGGAFGTFGLNIISGTLLVDTIFDPSALAKQDGTALLPDFSDADTIASTGTKGQLRAHKTSDTEAGVNTFLQFTGSGLWDKLFDSNHPNFFGADGSIDFTARALIGSPYLVPGPGQIPDPVTAFGWDFKDVGQAFTISSPSCNVDIEKLVRKYQTNDPFVDADLCTDAEVPVIAVPGGAEYKLIVQNTGESDLANCTITDLTLGINEPIGNLASGETKTFTGTDIPELIKPDRCQAVGELPNTASIVCDCVDIPDQQATDSDDACVKCVKPCIDLEKEVSVDGGTIWHDADDCADAPVTNSDAEYRLIVKNCGPEGLTNVIITDSVLVINTPIADLAVGETRTLDKNDIPQLNKPDLCPLTPGQPGVIDGSLLNTARVDAVGQESGIPVFDTDPACVKCRDCCIEIIKTATPVDLTCVNGLWWLPNRCKCCKTFGCIDKCCTVPKVKYTYKIKNLCDPVKNVKVVDNKFGTIATIPYLGTGQEKIITKTKCVCNTTTNIATVKGYLVSDPVTFCTDSDTETVTVSKPW